MPNYKVTAAQIDELLPQTQCGECGYPGCLPYAKAIANKHEALNLCPPGGVDTLTRLGELLAQDVSQLISEMQQNMRRPKLAKIREQECIGCTKCIKACPVDAIIGSAKQMHVIINNECTGCELCVPACPVDCIDLIAIDKANYDPELARIRYGARNRRQAKEQAEKNLTALRKKSLANDHITDLRAAKKAEIKAAVARVKAKQQGR